MIRIISNNGKTNIGVWHDTFDAVAVFKAYYALIDLYGKNSHSIDFSDCHANRHTDIQDYTLKLLTPLFKEREKFMHLNKLNGVLPDSRLMFTGFHKLMVGGYEYDYAGHSFVQVEFRYIIEHMTGCDL